MRKIVKKTEISRGGGEKTGKNWKLRLEVR